MSVVRLMLLFIAANAFPVLCKADSVTEDIADSYFAYHDEKKTLSFLQGRPASGKQKDYLRVDSARRLIKKLAKDDPSVRVEQARNRMLGWRADMQYLSAGADCEPQTTAMFDQMLTDMEPLLEVATKHWTLGTPKRWGHDDNEWREYYAYENLKDENNRFIGQFKKQAKTVFAKCSDQKGFAYDQWKMNHIDRQIKRANKRIRNRFQAGQITADVYYLALTELEALRQARNRHKYDENRGLWTNFDPQTAPYYKSLNQLLALGNGASTGAFLLPLEQSESLPLSN